MKQRYRYEPLILYSYYDRTGIAKHLAEMAAKGWMLDKLGSWSWRYRRTEPRTLHFAVTYFPSASQFDPHPSEEQETLWDFCAAAGWELVTSSAQVQIFYNEQEHPVPIETDPAVEFDTMNRSMKRGFLSSYWGLLVISLLEIAMNLHQLWKNPIDVLSDFSRLTSCFGYLPLLILTSVELARYYRWRRRARDAVEAGAALPALHSSRKLSAFILVCTFLEVLLMLALSSRGTAVLMVLIFLYMALMFFLVNTAKNAMKHLNLKKGVNMAVTFGMIIALTIGMMGGMMALIFKTGSGWLEGRPPAETYEYHGITWEVYHDEIPLRIEDLMDVEYDKWSTEAHESSSFLLTHREYLQKARLGAPKHTPDLVYEIAEVHAPFLYDLCKRDMMTRYWYNHPEEYRDNFLPVDPAPWGAEEVYQRHNYDGTPSNYYLLCWENRIAEILFYWAPTPEQQALAGETLKRA